MGFFMKIVLLCVFITSQTDGQNNALTPTLKESKEYLTSVVDALWEKIKEYGIWNLPVLDITAEYNITTIGFTLLGPVSIEDGFVLDMSSVTLGAQQFRTSTYPSKSMIDGEILIKGLQIFRDFRADFTTESRIGSIVLSPVNCGFDIKIEKEHNNNTIVYTISNAHASNIVWDIRPDDILTGIMRRSFSHKSTNTTGSLLYDTLQSWMPIFTKMLDEIIPKMKYPDLVV